MLVTLGHGNLGRRELGALIAGAGVALLVDVRRSPGSRRHPHVNRGELERWVPELGITYRWIEDLGGRRTAHPNSPHGALTDDAFRGYADHMATPAFRRALLHVVEEAQRRTVAVLCAEGDPNRCHRQLIADAAVLLHGLTVQHLTHDGRREAHTPSAIARIEGERVVYDVGGVQPTLFER
jgi:uncharacterized protein (DUF488 family)